MQSVKDACSPKNMLGQRESKKQVNHLKIFKQFLAYKSIYIWEDEIQKCAQTALSRFFGYFSNFLLCMQMGTFYY